MNFLMGTLMARNSVAPALAGAQFAAHGPSDKHSKLGPGLRSGQALRRGDDASRIRLSRFGAQVKRA